MRTTTCLGRLGAAASSVRSNRELVIRIKMAAPPVKEEKPQMTIHQREDSDIQLEELFQIGLNNAGAKRPLSIPMKMRNLPSSFFTPPTVGSKSPSVHSRENSLDNTGPFSPGPVASPGLGQPAGPGPQAHHSRANSCPATLGQTLAVAQQHQVGATTNIHKIIDIIIIIDTTAITVNFQTILMNGHCEKHHLQKCPPPTRQTLVVTEKTLGVVCAPPALMCRLCIVTCRPPVPSTPPPACSGSGSAASAACMAAVVALSPGPVAHQGVRKCCLLASRRRGTKYFVRHNFG